MDENKITNLEEIRERIIQVFEEKWQENFIFDSNNNEKISYSEFLSETLSICQELKNRGVKSNDIFCTILNNSADFIKMYFAALISNITIVPIDPEKGIDEINEVINYVKPKTIIVDQNRSDFFQNIIQIQDINLTVNFDKKNILLALSQMDTERDFLITFTSGSTGKPKGVIHSIKNLILSAISFNEKFNFNSKNIFFHNLPMSYMAGILNLIFLPFICKSKIVVGTRFSLKNAINFWKIPIEYSVNTFWFTPTIIGLLLKFDRDDEGEKFAKRNKIIGCVGTAPLNNSIKNEFENKYKIKLYESYGLSEVLFVSTNVPKQNNQNAGELLNRVKLDFQEKEILINVPWMFKNYQNLNKDDYLKKGYFISGDLGNISENNFLTITGRKKDLIIKGGINISPKKLEDFIINEGFFKECVVLGFPDNVLGEKTVCFILEYDNQNDLKKELNKKIIQKLGKDYHIDNFVQLKDIPKTINGKINKPKIRDMYLKNEIS